MLLGVSLPPDLPPRTKEAYFTACNKILGILAITSKFCDWEATTQAISDSLIEIAWILTAIHTVSQPDRIIFAELVKRNRYLH
jgi:hypothetical protein